MSLCDTMPLAAAELEKLTRCHAINLSPDVQCSVEEAGLAVGEVVGLCSIKGRSTRKRFWCK